MKNESQVINDWTKETLVVDMVNSIGEKYHFEVEPYANPNTIPLRSSNSLADKNGKVFVWAHFPCPQQLDMFKDL